MCVRFNACSNSLGNITLPREDALSTFNTTAVIPIMHRRTVCRRCPVSNFFFQNPTVANPPNSVIPANAGTHLPTCRRGEKAGGCRGRVACLFLAPPARGWRWGHDAAMVSPERPFLIGFPLIYPDGWNSPSPPIRPRPARPSRLTETAGRRSANGFFSPACSPPAMSPMRRALWVCRRPARIACAVGSTARHLTRLGSGRWRSMRKVWPIPSPALRK